MAQSANAVPIEVSEKARSTLAQGPMDGIYRDATSAVHLAQPTIDKRRH